MLWKLSFPSCLCFLTQACYHNLDGVPVHLFLAHHRNCPKRSIRASAAPSTAKVPDNPYVTSDEMMRPSICGDDSLLLSFGVPRCRLRA